MTEEDRGSNARRRTATARKAVATRSTMRHLRSLAAVGAHRGSGPLGRRAAQLCELDRVEVRVVLGAHQRFRLVVVRHGEEQDETGVPEGDRAAGRRVERRRGVRPVVQAGAT